MLPLEAGAGAPGVGGEGQVGGGGWKDVAGATYSAILFQLKPRRVTLHCKPRPSVREFSVWTSGLQLFGYP